MKFKIEILLGFFLVISADISANNLCKQSGSRSFLTKCRGPSGHKYFDTDGIPVRIFRKSLFWKKNQQTMKKYSESMVRPEFFIS